MMRYGGGVPRFARFAVCDYGTGHLSAMAVLLGLFHKVRTGEGQHVATSLMQAGAHHQAMFMIAYDGKRWDEPSGDEVLGWNETTGCVSQPTVGSTRSAMSTHRSSKSRR